MKWSPLWFTCKNIYLQLAIVACRLLFNKSTISKSSVHSSMAATGDKIKLEYTTHMNHIHHKNLTQQFHSLQKQTQKQMRALAGEWWITLTAPCIIFVRLPNITSSDTSTGTKFCLLWGRGKYVCCELKTCLAWMFCYWSELVQVNTGRSKRIHLCLSEQSCRRRLYCICAHTPSPETEELWENL